MSSLEQLFDDFNTSDIVLSLAQKLEFGQNKWFIESECYLDVYDLQQKV